MIKINFAHHLKHVERVVTTNSPMILTGIGVIGTVATAVLSVRSGMAAQEHLQTAAGHKNLNREGTDPYYSTKDFTPKEKFALTWKLYILPVCSATLTVGCIIGAQKINAKRAAALAGFLALTQDDLKAHKDKLSEKLSGPKYKEAEDEIAQKKFDAAYADGANIKLGAGQVLCYEPYTGRLFASTRVELERAEVAMQKKIHSEDSASMWDFYKMIGLPQTAMSDSYGWNSNTPFEVEFTAVFTEDETAPATAINYVEPPMYRPWEAGSFR